MLCFTMNQDVHLQGTNYTALTALQAHTLRHIQTYFFCAVTICTDTVLVATLKSPTFRLSCTGFMTATKSPSKQQCVCVNVLCSCWLPMHQRISQLTEGRLLHAVDIQGFIHLACPACSLESPGRLRKNLNRQNVTLIPAKHADRAFVASQFFDNSLMKSWCKLLSQTATRAAYHASVGGRQEGSVQHLQISLRVSRLTSAVSAFTYVSAVTQPKKTKRSATDVPPFSIHTVHM